VKFTVN